MTALPAWLQIVIGVSNAAVLVLLAILLVFAVLAAISVRRATIEAAVRLDALSNRIRDDIGPVLKDAVSLVTDLKNITMTVHEDAQTIHRVVTKTAGQIDRLTDAVEDRAERMGDLVDLVQDEAEDIVQSAVAATRRVRNLTNLGSLWRRMRDRMRS